MTKNDNRDMPPQVPILADAILKTALDLDSTDVEFYGALGLVMIDLLIMSKPTKEQRLDNFAHWAAAVIGTLERRKEPAVQ
jgi:hypothetical protein